MSDTGHGIAAGKLAHVFDPFFTTKPDGMGMGLPISRTIIEAHGGRLWAENNDGRRRDISFYAEHRGRSEGRGQGEGRDGGRQSVVEGPGSSRDELTDG